MNTHFSAKLASLAGIGLLLLGLASCKPDYMGPAAHKEPSGPQIEKHAHAPEASPSPASSGAAGQSPTRPGMSPSS